MKKALALILAVVMCIGMASVAFAIDVDYDIHHFTILGSNGQFSSTLTQAATSLM